MQVLSTEIKEVVTAKVRALEGIKCDVCGRIIKPDRSRSKKNKYYDVKTGHNDWGNDSWESRTHHDICPDCINAFVTKYLDEANGTEYIEVDPEFVWPEDVKT